jgi:hypothetical protein
MQPSPTPISAAISLSWRHQQNVEFGYKWVADHAKAGKRARRQVLMEEYGLKVGDALVADSAAAKHGSSAGLVPS